MSANKRSAATAFLISIAVLSSACGIGSSETSEPTSTTTSAPTSMPVSPPHTPPAVPTPTSLPQALEATIPIPDEGILQFSAIAAGHIHTCGLNTNGTVKCWGGSLFGQTDSPDGQFTAITAGSAHSCALRTDNTIECWGNNEYGQTVHRHHSQHTRAFMRH